MKLYFNEKNQLIFDGHDIGKTVHHLIGDTDYEYLYTIEFEQAKKIATLLQIDIHDKMTFLNKVKTQFNENDAYSKFGEFMKKNNILFEQFTWR